jgi:hypothetical protein
MDPSFELGTFNMPGDRSLFRQLQVVLDYSRERKHDDVDALVRHIASRHSSSFIYYWRDRESGKIRHALSERSMRTAISLAVDLRLLEERAGVIGLTRAGIAACDANRFRAVLGRQVSEFMERGNVGLSRIEKTIQALLSRRPPVVPTAGNILEQLAVKDEEADTDLLRRLLALLGHSGVLEMSQRRIFLPAHSTQRGN